MFYWLREGGLTSIDSVRCIKRMLNISKLRQLNSLGETADRVPSFDICKL
jgi:hypothetical protein